MDSREKALEELKKRIREQRARIDPDVLAAAARAATAGAEKKRPGNGTVPYDRAAAGKAVELFLKGHADAEGFRRKLLLFLKKNSQ